MCVCVLLIAICFFCFTFFVPEFHREPCAYLHSPPEERQAGPRPQWSSSFTCFTKQKTEGETNNQANKVLLFFFLPKKHKQIIDNTKQPQQPRQETQTTVPPDPPRFRSLSPKRQSAAAKTCTRANSTTSQKIVQCFLQKKNELKIHGGLDEKAGATHARLRRRPGQERPIGKSRVGSFRFSMCSCGPCKKKWHRSSFQMFGHHRSGTAPKSVFPLET